MELTSVFFILADVSKEFAQAQEGALIAKSEYQKMFTAETSYFWFVAKQGLVEKILHKIPLPKNPSILDLGCGTGINLKTLERFGFAIGLDYFPEALRYCLKRNCQNLLLSPEEILPFPDQSFDLIVSLDTIEHTSQPEQMLQEVYRVLAPAGFFLITAPAHPPLYSRHDYVLGHKLRYTRKSLAQLVKNAGFQIKIAGNFYGLVFPIAMTLKIFQKFLGSKTQTIPYYLPFPINQILLKLCQLENLFFPYFRLPFGTTLVFLCQKTIDH